MYKDTFTQTTLFINFDCRSLLGTISPNFFAKWKVAGKQCLAKNSKLNFINKVVGLKLSQNSRNYECHSPNAVRPKRYQIFCARKILAQMLMKSTLGLSWIAWRLKMWKVMKHDHISSTFNMPHVSIHFKVREKMYWTSSDRSTIGRLNQGSQTQIGWRDTF